jgi:amino acid transporter
MVMVLLGGVEALIVGKLANEIMPIPVFACAAGFLIGTWAICRSGIQVGYRAQIIATGMLFTLTVVLCAVQVFKTAQSGLLAEWLLPTFPGGLAILAAVGQAMFLFMGFELITSHAEIARNGSIKLSLRRAIPFLTVFYIVLAVGISTLSTSPSMEEYFFVPQLALANATGDNLAVAPVILIFVLASFSSYNGALLGLSRFVYALARQGTLPRSLAVLDPKTLTARPALAALLIISLFLMGLVYLSSFYLPAILTAAVIAAAMYALMAVLRERAPFLEKDRTASARLLGTLVAFALLAIASGVVISAGDYRFSVLFILAALFIFSAYLACGAASRKRSNILRQGAGCMARLLLRNTISK